MTDDTQLNTAEKSHLELFSELRGVALSVDPQHVFVRERKLADWDGCLAAQAGF